MGHHAEPFTHDASLDRTTTLADGRTLGWSDFGDPEGVPILSCHGGLLCRLDAEPAHEAARSMGVRLISPDRPGVATSSPKPGRDTLDWAADVTELVDALGIERFAVLGWSMGGQYALAVAHGLGARVTATAVIAGCPPLDDAATFAELNSMDRKLTELSRDHAAMARTRFRAIGLLEDHFPERVGKLTSKKSPAADREVMVGQAHWLGAATAAALDDPDGMVEEYRAWVRPWRFTLADVPGPVTVWQGTDDQLVPEAWGQRIADGTGGELHALDGEGHMIGVTRRAEVLSRLLELAGGER